MTIEAKNIGIIVSNGRTGTKFLSEFFDRNFESITSLHEPKPSYALRRYSNAYLVNKVSDDQMIRLLQRKRKKLMSTIHTETYIESNPYLHGFLPFFNTVWPTPNIIHVVRDPRDAITSGLNHQDAHFIKKFANQWVPDWVPDVKRILQPDRPLSPIGIYAAFWRVVNESIQKTGEQQSHYERLTYENIFDEDCTGLKRICEIMSIDIHDSIDIVSPKLRINKSISSRTASWPNWTPAQCAEVHSICSPLMQHYGYGLEQSWLERVQEGMGEYEEQ